MTVQVSSSEGWQLEGNSAEAYERYLAAAFSPWADQLAALAEIGAGDRVLDLGCGTGIVARHAARRAGRSGAVVGLDVNEDMLAVAKVACSAIQPAIEWRVGNAAALPFADNTFDAVCCEQAIQFFSDPHAALREVHRVLAPRGRLALSVCRPIRFCPAYAELANALDRHVGPDAGALMRSPFCAWDIDDVRGLFASAGFGDARVRIVVDSLRYPSCGELLRQEAACSPLANAVAALSADARRALIRDIDTALADHLDDGGVVVAIEAYVALARRS